MKSSLPFDGITQDQWVDFVTYVETRLDTLSDEGVDVETQGFALLTLAVTTLSAAGHGRDTLMHNILSIHDALYEMLVQTRVDLDIDPTPIITLPGGEA